MERRLITEDEYWISVSSEWIGLIQQTSAFNRFPAIAQCLANMATNGQYAMLEHCKTDGGHLWISLQAIMNPVDIRRGTSFQTT